MTQREGLSVENLVIAYPGFSADYSLRVEAGALCALIGPSGGGKTTLLLAIAGFEAPVGGALRFAGADLLGVAPARRPVTILFQENNLFPHLSAYDNAALGVNPGLRLGAEQRARVTQALARVGLAGKEGRRPAELSGGERQRAALARALVREKPLLLLDEPFSGLDPGLRRGMLALVDDLRRETGMSVLMSLHTPEDMTGAADTAAFIEDGRVALTGPPDILLARRSHAGLNAYLGRAA